ncbi:MAG: ATP-binding protein [Ignavibacteria bacterium]|jgi:two-component system NtrC family sensor kinase
MKNSFFNKLAVKLTIITSIILFITLAVQSFFTSKTLQEDLVRACALNTYRMSEIIKNATLFGMQRNNRNDIQEVVKNISLEKGLEAIRIYDKSGMIVYSNNLTELNNMIEINSGICSPCHFSSVPLEDLSIEDRIKIEINKDDTRTLVLLNPIQNYESCYTADCHAHNNSVKVLGVLEVKVSLKKVDDIIAANVDNVLLNSLIETIILAIVIGILINFFINNPISKISQGIGEIAKGNLKYNIDLKRNDELGIVASQFNKMSEKLKAAYNEIQKWNETLNQKVEEKTEELKSVYEQVVQIEKLASLGKLSSTVAHELNNPLEGILTYSKLIAKKLSKLGNTAELDKMQEFLKLIADESSRCGKIVKDLLIFSQQHEEEFVEYDIVEVINKSVLMINHLLELNKIRLEKIFDKDELRINCNGQKLQQALMSLLINAVESIQEDGIIKVTLNQFKDKISIRITDNGTGISDKDLSHIFEPFYSTKQKMKGTGLGLAVAYGIIKSHNGEIEVEETSPRGTTFLIKLSVNNGNNKNEQQP